MKNATLLLFTLIVLVGCSDKVVRIACIGDSITEGAGLAIQSETSYPVMLQKKLGQGYAVMNNGRSATTLQRKGDFPYWISKEFSNTFAYKPNIVVIKLGTNDTKIQNWNAKAFEHDYQALLDTIRTISTHPRIVVCLPVPVYKTEWGINDSTLVHGVLPIIQKLAEKNNLTMIDLYNGMSHHNDYFPDNIHPNEAGAKVMANLIADQIMRKKDLVYFKHDFIWRH